MGNIMREDLSNGGDDFEMWGAGVDTPLRTMYIFWSYRRTACLERKG